MAIATINPTTGVVEQEFDAHSEAEVDARIGQAHSAFRALKSTTIATRAEWMRAAADLLEADVESAARMLTTEMGKTIVQARAEVRKSANTMRFYAEHAEEFLTGRAARRTRASSAPPRPTPGTSRSASCSRSCRGTIPSGR